jgi:hypothetical protein
MKFRNCWELEAGKKGAVDNICCHGLTLSAPNDVDLRFAVFLLWAKRRRSTSKYLNFPPYDVIGIKLKSMISVTNIAVR